MTAAFWCRRRSCSAAPARGPWRLPGADRLGLVLAPHVRHRGGGGIRHRAQHPRTSEGATQRRPGAANDAVFTWLHQDIGRFLMPPSVLVMLAVGAVWWSKWDRTPSGWATIAGMICHVAGRHGLRLRQPAIDVPADDISTGGAPDRRRRAARHHVVWGAAARHRGVPGRGGAAGLRRRPRPLDDIAR